MVDHSRLPLGPRRLAVHARIGGTARRQADREVMPLSATVIPRAGGESSTPPPIGPNVDRRGVLDRPVKPGDDGGGWVDDASRHAPLRNCSGSTGEDPLRISKWSCGEPTSPD